jgi:hypothetical protein
MEAAHVEAASTGGLGCVENLRPCCAGCNKDMGTGLLWHFRSIWAEKPWYIAAIDAPADLMPFCCHPAMLVRSWPGAIG